MVFVIHWHESAMDLHVFPIPIPTPTSLSTRYLWVFPVHQIRALVMHPTWAVICLFFSKNAVIWALTTSSSPSAFLCTLCCSHNEHLEFSEIAMFFKSHETYFVPLSTKIYTLSYLLGIFLFKLQKPVLMFLYWSRGLPPSKLENGS